MYKMPEFTEKDQEAVVAFMKSHNFITLIGSYENTPVATQVPVLFDERDGKIILRGHIMRQTDHCKAFEQNPQALALFTGPHCYVSASWYKERHTGSTWNYMTVHTRGPIQLLDEAATVQLITDLTHHYEDKQTTPEIVENMPANYVQGMVKAISAFEMTIEQIAPIFKLSQNRSDESFKNIVEQLNATGDHESKLIAEEMMKRRP